MSRQFSRGWHVAVAARPPVTGVAPFVRGSWHVIVAEAMESMTRRDDGLRNRPAVGNLQSASTVPARPGNARMLNRIAVVVECREAFRDWLRSIGVQDEEFVDHADTSVCMVGECAHAEDQQEVLQESFATIFHEAVSAWHLDPEQRPDCDDFALVQSWFETGVATWCLTRSTNR